MENLNLPTLVGQKLAPVSSLVPSSLSPTKVADATCAVADAMQKVVCVVFRKYLKIIYS